MKLPESGSESDYSQPLQAFDASIACIKAHWALLSVTPFIVNMQVT